MANIGRIVRYSGQVQGVGFRYTALRLAGAFEITGYVSNLPDGDVEILAEGPDEQVRGFLSAVHEQMGSYIQDHQQEDRQPTGHFASFNIRL